MLDTLFCKFGCSLRCSRRRTYGDKLLRSWGSRRRLHILNKSGLPSSCRMFPSLWGLFL